MFGFACSYSYLLFIGGAMGVWMGRCVWFDGLMIDTLYFFFFFFFVLWFCVFMTWL